MIARVTGCSASGSRLDQRLGRGVALGDPRAFVEQPRDLGERREVELDDRERRAPRPLDVAREGRLGLRVAEEHALVLARDADAQARGGRRDSAGRGKRPRIGVGGVVARRAT